MALTIRMTFTGLCSVVPLRTAANAEPTSAMILLVDAREPKTKPRPEWECVATAVDLGRCGHELKDAHVPAIVYPDPSVGSLGTLQTFIPVMKDIRVGAQTGGSSLVFRGFEGDEENENLETGYDAFKHRVIGLEEGTEGRWALDLGAIQPSPDAPVVTRLMLDRGTLRVSRLGVGADGMEADITWGTETPRPRASRLEWVLEVEEGQEVANAEFSYVSFGDIRWESIKLPSTGTVDLLIMNECGCEYYAGGDENEENETGGNDGEENETNEATDVESFHWIYQLAHWGGPIEEKACRLPSIAKGVSSDDPYCPTLRFEEAVHPGSDFPPSHKFAL